MEFPIIANPIIIGNKNIVYKKTIKNAYYLKNLNYF